MDTLPRQLPDAPPDEREGGTPSHSGDADRRPRPGSGDRPEARPGRRPDEPIPGALARILLPRPGDSPRTTRLRGYFKAAATSVLALGLIVSCYALGALPADALLPLAGGSIAAMLALYAAFRAGVNLRAQASESRLAQTQRIARLGCWSFDPRGKEVFWSPETYRIFGVDPHAPVPDRRRVRATAPPRGSSALPGIDPTGARRRTRIR